MIAVSIIGIFEAYAISTQPTAGMEAQPRVKCSKTQALQRKLLNKSYAADLVGFGYSGAAIY